MSLRPNNRPKGEMTAIYMRLSNDDGDKTESESISNQREYLLDYCTKNNIKNVVEFSDDGVSGMLFDRPGLNAMFDGIRAGKIGAVITKDLSRLGRGSRAMDEITDVFFPLHNVHYIALANSIDTSKEGYENSMHVLLFVNEFQVRDTSVKVRTIKNMQAEKGQRVNGSLTPFGYAFDGEKLIVDEEVAPIVSRIFKLCASGLGPSQIAKKLTAEKVVTPYTYKGYRTGGTVSYPERWSETTIGKMLERKEYIGHTVTKKSYVVSYKNKKRIFNDEKDMLIFYNTHEPLIDEQTFEIVQSIRKNKKRTTKMGEQPMFSGLLFCADCGKAEYIFRGTTIDEGQYTYNCGTYRSKSRACTPHGIRVVVLEQLVLAHIKMVTSYAVGNEKQFAEKLMESSLKDKKSNLSKRKRELDKAKHRNVELDKLFTKIYEDRTLGNLSEERYQKLSDGYDQEQAELIELITSSEKEITSEADTVNGIDKFLKIAKKYLDLQKLDGTILRELIEKIVVHEKVRDGGEVKAGKKVISQQIDIHYNFVGIVETE